MAEREYRISWEMVDPHQAEAIEARYGKSYWRQYWDDPRLRWARVERIGSLDDIQDQHRTLSAWEQHREEPVRNVKLEWREPGPWHDITTIQGSAEEVSRG